MIISTDNSTIRHAFGDLESIRLIKEAGFDGIDYSLNGMKPENDILNLPDGERQKLAYELRNYAEKIGICFPQAHADFAFRYGEDKDSAHYHDLLSSIEFASWMGVPQIVVHTVKYGIPDYYGYDLLGDNRKFFTELLPFAESHNIKIGLENLFLKNKKCDSFSGVLGTPEEMNAYIDSIGADKFVCCCDLGHAAVTRIEPQDFIRGMSKDRLTMIHVQDCDYRGDRHWLPFIGQLDWEAITDALAEIGYEGSLNFEILHFYDRFPPELMPSALKLAADVARYLANRVEAKKAALNK